MTFLPRDFIETPEGLIFAVLSPLTEADRVLCYLRYYRDGQKLCKVETGAVDGLMRLKAPAYRFYSERLDVALHGVGLSRIIRHFRPRERVADLLSRDDLDLMEAKAVRWLEIMLDAGLPLNVVGISGSILIGAQHGASDLDFVIYDRAIFHQARAAVARLAGMGVFDKPDEDYWRSAYNRRGCSLTFDEYMLHEKRKHNMGWLDGVKFDVTLVTADAAEQPGSFQKSGFKVLRALVTDASRAFDFPAVYGLAHSEVGEALSFTHTYAGQAMQGEWVEISGMVEVADTGQARIVVGSSREAPGEFIRCVPGG